jgi:hypothetical protein
MDMPVAVKRQKENIEEATLATSDETIEPMIGELIHQFEENEVEQKKSATGEKSKADEALAAVATWNDHLVEGRNERGWHAIPTAGLAKALDGFRVFGLWWWRRRMKRKFSMWTCSSSRWYTFLQI